MIDYITSETLFNYMVSDGTTYKLFLSMSPDARRKSAMGETTHVGNKAWEGFKREFNNNAIIYSRDIVKAQREYANVTSQDMKRDNI